MLSDSDAELKSLEQRLVFYDMIQRDLLWMERTWANVDDIASNYRLSNMPRQILQYLDTLTSTQSLNFLLILFHCCSVEHPSHHTLLEVFLTKLQSSCNPYQELFNKIIPLFYRHRFIHLAVFDSLFMKETLPYIRSTCLCLFKFRLFIVCSFSFCFSNIFQFLLYLFLL